MVEALAPPREPPPRSIVLALAPPRLWRAAAGIPHGVGASAGVSERVPTGRAATRATPGPGFARPRRDTALAHIAGLLLGLPGRGPGLAAGAGAGLTAALPARTLLALLAGLVHLLLVLDVGPVGVEVRGVVDVHVVLDMAAAQLQAQAVAAPKARPVANRQRRSRRGRGNSSWGRGPGSSPRPAPLAGLSPCWAGTGARRSPPGRPERSGWHCSLGR